MGILPEKATKQKIPSFDQMKSFKFSGEVKVGQDSSGPHLAENQHNEGRILQDVLKQIGDDFDGEAAGDASGFSVSMSNDGKRIAIGFVLNDANGIIDSGRVRIYEWDGASWIQIGNNIDGVFAGDRFGWSVSISNDGKKVAIGAIYNDANRGHVRMYEWVGTSWIQMGGDINGEAVDDQFGHSVSMSNDGKRVAIGAIFNDSGNVSDSGHVRIYEWNDEEWILIGDIDGVAAEDRFGSSVSMSNDGKRVAIGAPLNDGDNGKNTGHMRIYDWNDNSWSKIGGDMKGNAAEDQFGYSVSMSNDGKRVAIGARYNNGENGINSGHVGVYEFMSDVWIQVGDDIDGEAADDNSGYSVSLSNDGKRVAIGAHGNDGRNGINSGHARVYDWNGESWSLVGGDIDGEAADDGSGWSLSMSNNGKWVAIGARYNGGNGTDSGHVRVYELPPTAITWEITPPEDWTVDFTADTEIVGVYAVTEGQAWRARVLSKDCELSSALNNTDTGSPFSTTIPPVLE